MWRIVTIIVAVIVVDFLLLLWAEASVFDYDCTEVTRFVDAREHPTPDTMRAFEAARDKTLEIQGRVRLQFGCAIFIITAGGFFMAGRQFALRKKNVRATSGEEAESRT